MAIKVYEVGALVRAAGAFTDADGVTAVDPSTVTLKYIAPDGTVVSWVYQTDSEVVRDSVGNFHADIPVAAPGTWRTRWEGMGAVVAAGEREFRVKDSRFS